MECRYHKWTQQEEILLKQLTDKYGLKWELIRRRGFPYLTPIAIKNKYYSNRNAKYKGYTRYQKNSMDYIPQEVKDQANVDYLVQQIKLLLQENDSQ